MGVLNVTPDSFSDGGQLFRDSALDLDALWRRAEGMLAEGASILDVGGESTRPGAAPVSLSQELDRVIPAVEGLAQRFDVVLSVDTSTPEVMTQAADVGAGLINDVRALRRPGAMNAAAETGLPVCLMHMQGEPDTMQDAPAYDSVTDEVVDFLSQRISACLTAGIEAHQILVDPGFGFGKSVAHNFTLLRELDRLQELRVPVLAGLSRKSMIAKVVAEPAMSRVPASVTLAVLAAQRGARILRVHDVAATRDGLAMLAAMENKS